MSLLESVVVPMGTTMIDFQLKTPKGKVYRGYDSFGKKGLLVVFSCNHCPYAVALWPRLIRIAKESKELGINTLAINPNINPDYPADSPQQMVVKANAWGIDFPYLVDDTQKVAKLFMAQCTPDIYLFNSAKGLVYHGRVDDNWQDEGHVSKHDLRQAIQNLATGQPISLDQKPSRGCAIKWVS